MRQSQSVPTSKQHPATRSFMTLSALVISYVLTGLLAFNLSPTDSNLPLIWIPTGVSLGLVLIHGYRYSIGAFIGAILLGIIISADTFTSVVIGSIDTATILFAAYLLRQRFPIRFSFDRFQDVIRLVFIGAVLSPLPGTCLHLLYFLLSQLATTEQILLIVSVSWISNMLAIIVVTPLILVWCYDYSLYNTPQQWIEVIALFASTAFVAYLIFDDLLLLTKFSPLTYILVPFSVWAILRFKQREVIGLLAIISSISLWGMTQNTSLTADTSLVERAVFVWTFIGIGALVTMLLKVIVDERQEIKQALIAERDFALQIMESLGQGISVTDVEGNYEYVNPSLAELIGILPQDAIGKSPLDFVPENQFDLLQKARQLRKDGQNSSYESIAVHQSDGRIIPVLVSGVPRYNDGKVIGAISVITDLTNIVKTEQALKQSEANFRRLFETMQEGMYRTAPDGRMMMVNPALARMNGYDSEQDLIEAVNHNTVQWYVDPTRQEMFRQLIREQGYVTNLESEVFQIKTRERIWINENAHVVKDEDGKVLYYEGTVTNITKRKQAEEELRANEARFRAIFENTAIGIDVCTNADQIIQTNQALQKMLGYSAEELLRMNVEDFMHPEDRIEEMKAYKHARQAKLDYYAVRLRYIRKDKTIIWVHVTTSMILNEEGNLVYTIGISEDISNQIKAEKALQTSQFRFRSIFENANIPIAVTHNSRYISMANPAFCEMLGYSAEELEQMRFDDFTYPGDNDENLVEFEKLVAGEINYFTLSKRYIHRDGSIIWVNLSVSRFLDKESETEDENIYSIAIAENITERKYAEDQLLEQIRFTDKLIDTLPGIFYLYNEDRQFLRWNKTFEQVSAYTAAEFITLHPLDFFNEEDKPALEEAIQRVFDEGHATIEAPLRDKYGNSSPYFFTGFRIMMDETACLVGVGIDISELKLTEQALRESEESYRTIFENALIGIYRSTLDGRFLSVNPAMVELLGFDSAEELYQLNISQDLHVHPDDRDKMNALYRNQDVVEEHAVHLKKKNGDVIIVSSKAKVIHDEEGNILYFDGNLRDVTEQQRQAEQIQQLNEELEERVHQRTLQLERANEQLKELDRLKSKFIADVSHELRTPLAVLNTRMYLLERNKGNLDQHIENFKVQLERLQDFVENVFDLSILDLKPEHIEFASVDLNVIVKSVVDEMAPRAEVNNLTLEFTADSSIPNIYGVQSHLSQVATNLIGNALKYTQEGWVKIQTGKDVSGRQVYLKVSDSGMGIAEKDIPHLFDRFYRGESTGQSNIPGTGLGLSIVKEIVDNHHGEIRVESELKQGTVFTVWLPSLELIQIQDYGEDKAATLDE